VLTNIFIKFTILSLKINAIVTTTIKNKTKTIFRVYFSSLSIVSIDNLERFFYLISIKNSKTISKYKIIIAIYKTALDKILKIKKITN